MKKSFKICISIIMVIVLLASTVNIISAKDSIVTGPIYNSFTSTNPDEEYKFAYEFNEVSGVLTIEGLGILGNCGFYVSSDSAIKEVVFKEGIYFIALGSMNIGYSNPFKDVTTVTLPSTLKGFGLPGLNAFLNLETINYGGTEEMWKKINFNKTNLDAIKGKKINYNVDVPATEGAENFTCNMEANFSAWQGKEKFNLLLNLGTGKLTISGKGPFNSVIAPNMCAYRDEEGLLSVEEFVTDIVFSSGITSIGRFTFYDLPSLKSITIPKTVKKIQYESFGVLNDQYNTDWSKVDLDVYYQGTEAEWNKIDIGYSNGPIMRAEKHFVGKTKGADVTVTLSQTDFVYRQQPTHEYKDFDPHYYYLEPLYDYPQVIVKDKYGNVLKEGNDYYVDIIPVYTSSSIGRYKVEVNLMGAYSGKVIRYFYIRPVAPKVTKIEKRNDGFTIFWKKNQLSSGTRYGEVDGYEVQYSTSKNFSNAQSIIMKNRYSYAKNVSGLKTGTTYYVRVRARTHVASGYIHSNWSSTYRVVAG